MAVFIDRAIRRGLITASIVLAGHASPAFALEFGALTVRSHLNQPLDATVVLNGLDASERASLDVGIAPPAMFQRFGIRRSSAVDRIQLETRMSQGGRRAVVHIATNRPVSAPFVDFLLQVDSGNGRALREYTAMLNPAGGASAAPSRATRSTATSPAVRPARTTPSSSDRPAGSGESSHQVRAGETLWSIAAADTPSGATVAQTMLAIYRANPSAFDGSMSALSQNARLAIPGAANIRAVNASTAQRRLQNIEHNAGESGANGADNEARPAASGEAPPAALQDRGPSSASAGAGDAGATGTPTSSDANPVHADTATAGPFGQLSLPADAPWPAPQTSLAKPPASSAVASDSTSGTGPPGDATGTSEAAVTADASTPTTAATNPGSDSPATGGAEASPTVTPPPTDVSEADGSAWLSPRNLLLLVVLLALIGLAVRRLRERGYQPVTLDRGETRGEPAEAEPPAADATAMASAAGPSGYAPAADTLAPGQAGPAPEPSVAPEPERPVAPVASSAVSSDPEKPQPDLPLGAPLMANAPDAGALSSSRYDEDESAVHAEPAFETDVGPEPEPPQAPDRPMRFEPVPAPEPGDRLFAHRRPATNEEIEALAFEAQSLPEEGERRHDLGAGSEPGLDFDADSFAEPDGLGGDRDENDARRPDPYGLEMIDPGEFDLYDPPSATAAQADDDPNASVEIRLDLARMYIEMEDEKAARELLVDVRTRGDDEQRDAAEQLLERLGS
ncbi:FimV/HubP family polar landmark protein [Salinisphaera sp.]|uniref:FimV/HubP family polar landmark protein n=1 Tax=Salinisphaera sp. TaxID=1914330 RepID=UPI003C7AB72B